MYVFVFVNPFFSWVSAGPNGNIKSGLANMGLIFYWHGITPQTAVQCKKIKNPEQKSSFLSSIKKFKSLQYTKIKDYF
jgi:hypothetical protein